MTLDELIKSQLKKEDIYVYPVVIPESAKPPFILYREADVTYTRTLSGNSVQTKAEYDVSIVADTYSSLRTIEDAAVSKLLDLRGMELGDYVIDDAEVHVTGNGFIQDIGKYRADMRLTVSY
jgi:hypothetical protein